MKNILFLEQFSNISGGQRVLLNTIAGLDRTKYLPFVIVPGKGELTGELEKLGIRYSALPIGNYSAGRKNIIDIISYVLRTILLIPLTMRLIKREKIDLVYANAPRTFIFSACAARLCRVPVIWHLHSILSGIELRALAFALKRNVSAMIAVSNSVAAPFLRVNGTLKTKMNVVYNGIDQTELAELSPSAKLISEFGITSKTKVVTFIGQLVKWKGIEDLVRAASLVLKRNADSKFLIVGDVVFGDKKQERYKNYIKQLAIDLGIGDRIIFTGRRSDIADILSITSLVVIPSIEPDPCPLVLLEAMAAGKAVVSSAHGGPGEIIKDGFSGRLYPQGNVPELYRTIVDIISSPDLVKRLGDNARQTAKKDLTLEKYLSKVSGLIDKVLVS